MKQLQTIILFISLGSILLFAEQSVYGNGGYFSADKVIKKNKKIIASLQRKIMQQNERIDGLQSIIEGLSATVHQLQNRDITSNGTTQNSDNTALLKELGNMIDTINVNYVSKSDLQKVLKGKVLPVKTVLNEVTPNEDVSKNLIKNKSTSTLYSEGVRLFVKKRYDEAKKRFIATDTKGYKPAASNYYLGEIAYYTKKYEDAIFYYKKSAGLNDQASYMDTLLLHTAISLEKSGEKVQAKVFYENIIENYADKKTATIAKSKLKNL